MTNLTLRLNAEAEQNIQELKKYYGVSSKAAVISKSLGLLKTAAEIEQSPGKLVAKKGDKEVEILLR